MDRKRIMLLGGNYFQMTATLAAKRLGYYVISVDYLPDNPAHKFADEYHNVSTIDREAVLALARGLSIDGIVSYASDVSAPTAAYVAEQLGLPTNPLESVMTLTHKNLFRKFMRENGFPMPEGKSFIDREEARGFYERIAGTVMVKPVDSSGSKGVVKVSRMADFDAAWEEAMSYSLEKEVIVEQFIRKQGYQIDGDGFLVDGQIRIFGVMDQHHDMECAPYTPAGLSYPSRQPANIQQAAREQIQRIFDLLHMKMGAFNFEYIVDESGQVYVLEIGPRNGGNLIPDTLKAACGVDLAEYTVKIAVGDDCSDLRQLPAKTCATSYILHSDRDGRFCRVEIGETLRGEILKQAVFVNPGDPVRRFRNASMGIGAMVLAYPDVETMCSQMDHMSDHIHVVTEPHKNVTAAENDNEEQK